MPTRGGAAADTVVESIGRARASAVFSVQTRACAKPVPTITTPFDMTVLNDLDRFHLAMDTVDRLPQTGAAGAALKERLAAKLVEHGHYIRAHGLDMPEIRNWRWQPAP